MPRLGCDPMVGCQTEGDRSERCREAKIERGSERAQKGRFASAPRIPGARRMTGPAADERRCKVEQVADRQRVVNESARSFSTLVAEFTRCKGKPNSHCTSVTIIGSPRNLAESTSVANHSGQMPFFDWCSSVRRAFHTSVVADGIRLVDTLHAIPIIRRACRMHHGTFAFYRGFDRWQRTCWN